MIKPVKPVRLKVTKSFKPIKPIKNTKKRNKSNSSTVIIDGKKYTKILNFIPKHKGSKKPLIDELTTDLYNYLVIRGVMNRNKAITKFIPNVILIKCKCGAVSPNKMILLTDNIIVPTLAIHMVAFHRDEISERDIEILKQILPHKPYKINNPENNYLLYREKED